MLVPGGGVAVGAFHRHPFRRRSRSVVGEHDVCQIAVLRAAHVPHVERVPRRGELPKPDRAHQRRRKQLRSDRSPRGSTKLVTQAAAAHPEPRSQLRAIRRAVKVAQHREASRQATARGGAFMAVVVSRGDGLKQYDNRVRRRILSTSKRDVLRPSLSPGQCTNNLSGRRDAKAHREGRLHESQSDSLRRRAPSDRHVTRAGRRGQDEPDACTPARNRSRVDALDLESAHRKSRRNPLRR